MTWEEKLDALSALGDCNIKMRKPGDWYVSQSTEIGGNGMLEGDYGNGKTPIEAIEDHWSKLVDNLPSDRHIRAYDNKRYRWSGYMWKEASK